MCQLTDVLVFPAATLCNFDCDFEKQKFMMHVNTSHKTAILVKLGYIL